MESAPEAASCQGNSWRCRLGGAALLFGACLAASWASAARQGYFPAAAAYCALLAAMALVLAAFLWALLDKLLGKFAWGARAALGAAMILGAWLGWGMAGKFADFPIKRLEGGVKGSLGTIRSALSIYYGDHEGAYPESLEVLVPKYLAFLPVASSPRHGSSARVRAASGAADAADTGGWGYVAKGKGAGIVFVDCTHVDTRGAAFNSY